MGNCKEPYWQRVLFWFFKARLSYAKFQESQPPPNLLKVFKLRQIRHPTHPPLIPLPPPPDSADTEVKKEYNKYLLAFYSRKIEIFKDRKETIDDVNRTGSIIFWIVNTTFGLAVIFAGIEFCSGNKIKSRLVQNQPSLHEFQIWKDVAIKTTSNAIALLGIALAFYWLYLRFVYPITVVNP